MKRMSIFFVLIAILGLENCRTVQRDRGNSKDQADTKIQIILPDKSAFPAGSPTEKITRMDVSLEFFGSYSFCTDKSHQTEKFSVTALPAKFDFQVKGFCGYSVKVNLIADDDIAFAGSFSVNPGELKTSQTYKPNFSLTTPFSGIFMGFGRIIDIEQAPDPYVFRETVWEEKKTNFDVIYEPDIYPSNDVSKYLTVGDIVFDSTIVGSIWTGRTKFTKTHVKLNSVYVSCQIQAGSDFSSVERPTMIHKKASRWMYVDLPSGVEEIELKPEWAFTDLEMKLLKTIVPKSGRIENFRCIAFDDPRDPNHRIRTKSQQFP